MVRKFTLSKEYFFDLLMRKNWISLMEMYLVFL